MVERSKILGMVEMIVCPAFGQSTKEIRGFQKKGGVAEMTAVGLEGQLIDQIHFHTG